MKLACMSLVCRIVNVMDPDLAARRNSDNRMVMPLNAEAAKNKRRENVPNTSFAAMRLPRLVDLGCEDLFSIDYSI